jgi:hypothetical protein
MWQIPHRHELNPTIGTQNIRDLVQRCMEMSGSLRHSALACDLPCLRACESATPSYIRWSNANSNMAIGHCSCSHDGVVEAEDGLTELAPFPGRRMKLRRKKKKREPKDLGLQFLELKRLRSAVAKAEAEIAKEAVRQRRSFQKSRSRILLVR